MIRDANIIENDVDSPGIVSRVNQNIQTPHRNVVLNPDANMVKERNKRETEWKGKLEEIRSKVETLRA